MINLLYDINRKGLPPVPVTDDNTAPAASAAWPRSLYISLLAMITAASGVAAGWLISHIIPAIMSLLYNGQLQPEANGVENDELGIWIIFIPVAGALLLTWLGRYASPFLQASGLAVAIGAGAPMGAESPAMIFTGALGNWLGKIFRCSPAECYILLVAGITSTLGGIFGAPVAAIFLAIEIFFSAYTLAGLLPVICAAVIAGTGSYLIRGTNPLYSMDPVPGVNGNAILAYLAVGLLIGLWARLFTKLFRVVEKWFGKLTMKSRWYLLLSAILVGGCSYVSTKVPGTGSYYINDLLHAHVTLAILFGLAIMKLLAWLFFSGAYKTGTGITPLLIAGGAGSLLLGVLIQLLFPSLIVHTGILVLAGMGAMLAGTSRAVLTAVVLSLELTHDIHTALPVAGACIMAYSISSLRIKKRKATKYLAPVPEL
ncbi:chloride channel protein [Chitinophaga sp. 22321]|uniref:Chloride channel protein n=1 Tax=Chitinophaga hostae TaxID=2831022 RepID=A0ABS5IT38_9BACT|nr:chloride channel protein [Chitinophaga hostae]MBS0026126.1 chloride channel protein [Chitinophaga hostae]